MGFIVPNKFFKIKAGKKLRELLHTNNCVRKIVDFGTQQLFKNRITYTCLLFLERTK
ncbi:MAG: Eco57I restriction-modification methylase domain-containing protein [Thaumarchaeota archaeon]|nr:Eco57I restriction-modification methylase domain-containing protein [Nitrososphaerota archaeon]